MTPLEIHMLNNSHRDGTIEVAVFFNINADTPSDPVAFEVSSNRNISSISESEQKSDSNSDMSELQKLGGEWSGGTDRLRKLQVEIHTTSCFSMEPSTVILESVQIWLH